MSNKCIFLHFFNKSITMEQHALNPFEIAGIMNSSSGLEKLLFHFFFYFWLLLKFHFRNLGVGFFQFAKSHLLVDFCCMLVVCHLLKPREPSRTCRTGALQRSPRVSQRLSAGHNCHLHFHRCLESHSEQKHSIFGQNLQLNKNCKKTTPRWRLGFWHSTFCFDLYSQASAPF